MRKGFVFAAAMVIFTLFAIPAGAEGYWVTEAQGAKLAGRSLHPGDILCAEQLSRVEGTLTYRILENGKVGVPVQETFSLGLRKNQPPVALDSALETYRNMEITGRLEVTDNEKEALTYTLTRSPRRGVVTLHADGSFTYAPKKNKVGLDSFTYTARDEAGNLSREATVTVTIIRPTDDRRYADTMGKECAFAAEWMRRTGIFTGETLDGQLCFQPEKPITQAELLMMVVKVLDLPVEEEKLESAQEYPAWLRPYVAAAIRSGITGRIPCEMEPNWPATVSQAEALLCFGEDAPTAAPLTRGLASQLMLAAWKDTHPGRWKIIETQ